MPFEWWFLLGSGTTGGLEQHCVVPAQSISVWCDDDAGDVICIHLQVTFPFESSVPYLNLYYIYMYLYISYSFIYIYININIYIYQYIYINIRNTCTIHIQLVGGLEHFIFSIIYGMSSFPLTNPFFFKMVKSPPTRYSIFHIYIYNIKWNIEYLVGGDLTILYIYIYINIFSRWLKPPPTIDIC